MAATLVCLLHTPHQYQPPSHPLITRIPKPATWRLQAQQQQPRGFGSNPNPDNQYSKPKQEDIHKKKKKEEEGGDGDEIPQLVIERMAVRIVASVVMPMGIGLGLLSGFGALRDQNVWDVPFWVPVVTSFFTFGASALGIAYGALSCSWDPDTKGSFLGVEQLERNWVELWKE